MRKLTICLLLTATSAFGQQEPLFTQFWNSLTYFNPATGAQQNKMEAYALGRTQWTNINGHPSTLLGTFMTQVKSSRHSIGGSFMHDNIGYMRSEILKASYAYHLKLGAHSTLSFGASAGVKYLKVSDKIIFLYPPSPSFYLGSYRFVADFGVAFHRKKLDAGLSLTQLPRSSYANGFSDQTHLFAFAGYTFQLTRNFSIRPQAFYRSDFNFNSLDLGALFRYKDWYVGATYRSRDALGIIAGWDIKNRFRVTYSYDMWFSKLNNGVLGSTHEIGLGFLLKSNVNSTGRNSIEADF
jgi:type IX secretion system PorP/SprF family membrane protein